MQAGELRELVTLQQPVEVRGADYADVQRSWQNVATVWAAVEPLSGRELETNRELGAEITLRVRIRYRADVIPKWRLLHGATVYEIDAAINPLSDRRELHLLCTEYRKG